MAMKLGLSNWGMPKIGFDDFVRFAARTGYCGIELTVLPNWSTRLSTLTPGVVSSCRGLLAELDLDLPAIAAHSPLLSDSRVRVTDSELRLRRAIDLALEFDPIDPPAINTTVGGAPGDWENDRAKVLDRLGPLVEYARAAKVAIALEPHVGSTLHTPQQAVWVLGELGTEGLGVNFDYSHFLAQGIAVAEAVNQLAPHTLHTHLKGVAGRWPDHKFLVPGEDDYDYAGELALMDAAGYCGYQTLEVSFMVQDRPAYDPFESARLGYQTIAAAFTQAGL